MSNTSKNHENKLLFWGLLLFFFGLLAGLGMPLYTNTRMGLSAHLEGVMNGIFLVVLGLIWKKIRISKKSLSLLYVLSLYGGFANFTAVMIGAITGGGQLMPIANGQDKGNVIEGMISFLLITLTLAMLAVCILTLAGLYNNMKGTFTAERA